MQNHKFRKRTNTTNLKRGQTDQRKRKWRHSDTYLRRRRYIEYDSL